MIPANPAIPAGKAVGSMAANRSGRDRSGNVNNVNARSKAAAVAAPASDKICLQRIKSMQREATPAAFF